VASELANCSNLHIIVSAKRPNRARYASTQWPASDTVGLPYDCGGFIPSAVPLVKSDMGTFTESLIFSALEGSRLCMTVAGKATGRE
jgi:hypothetical protein